MSEFHWTGRDDSEDGPAARRVYHCHTAGGRHAIIGFESDEGVRRNQGRVGARDGPNAIRGPLAGLPIPADFPTFTDHGNIAVLGEELEQGQRLLGEAIVAAMQTHDRVLVLGGGHETAFGSFLGLRGAEPDAQIGILNFDAHLDIRQIGANGPSSGTPFNQIRDREGDDFDYLCIGVAVESNTQALFARAADWGVRMIMDYTLTESLADARHEIDALIERNDIIYLTIDLDVLPHYQAPGVSCPAVRGVPFSTIQTLVHYCLEGVQKQERRLPVCDIVELNPHHDHQQMTAKTAAILARQLLAG